MIELPIRVACVLAPQGPFDKSIHQRYTTCIKSSAPAAEISFYAPAEGRYPNPDDQYHLIIIGGGVTDAPYAKAWHERMMAFIKEVVAEHPGTRLLGIGLGHEIICLAYGGKVQLLTKPAIGITPLDLTLEGKFFLTRPEPSPEIQRLISFSQFPLPTYSTHRVITIPKNFLLLSARYEMLECCESPIDDSVCQILTIAAHPEYDAEVLKALFMDADKACGDEEVRKRFVESWDGEMGVEVEVWWNAVMQWVVTTRRRSSSGMKNPALFGLGIRGSETPSEDRERRERSESAIRGSKSPDSEEERGGAMLSGKKVSGL